LKNINIRGKVVMIINEGQPVDKKGISIITQSESLSDWSVKKNKRIQFILDKKPALILAVSTQVSDQLSRYKEYFTQPRIMLAEDFKKASENPAVAHITPETAELFFKGSNTSYKKLKQIIDKKEKPHSTTFKTNFTAAYGTTTTKVLSQNVLGFLEGSDLKDELVVISAHYDHIGIAEN